MTKRRILTFLIYAPALVGKDGRTLAVVHGMEQALPGLRLEWEVGKGGRPIALPRRDAWLAGKTEDGGFPLVCNGDESHPVTVTGGKDLDSSAQAVSPSLKCTRNCRWTSQ